MENNFGFRVRTAKDDNMAQYLSSTYHNNLTQSQRNSRNVNYIIYSERETNTDALKTTLTVPCVDITHTNSLLCLHFP